MLVIKRLARDLDLRSEIVGAPTLREDDGLAMSSRNIYLAREERLAAPALYRALREAARRIAEGEPIGHVMAEAREQIAAKGFLIDYLEARHARTSRASPAATMGRSGCWRGEARRDAAHRQCRRRGGAAAVRERR